MTSVRRLAGLFLACAALLGLNACVTTQQRFPADVQTAVSRADMQRLETDKLILYYPNGSRDEVLRVAARLEYCRTELEKHAPIKWGPAHEKSVFVLPKLPFNNAFIAPAGFGLEQIGLVPLYNTADYFVPMGIPPDPAYIGCHEMTHDVVMRQVSAQALGLRYFFQRGTFSPLDGIDPWFQEGIAVYNETKLQGHGRLWTPYFDGLFAAGMREPKRAGGWMSIYHRTPQYGGHYLIGSRFIDYLMRTYGEKTFWSLVARQSKVIASPFGVGGRFKRVYKKSLTTLIDEFYAFTQRRYPPRSRPAGQRSLWHLGVAATMAQARSGHVAIITQDLDKPVRIVVLSPDGKELVSRRLTDVGFGRRLIRPSTMGASGLSLTADGQHAYFVMLDTGPIYAESRLVHLDVTRNKLEIIADDVKGSGGSVSPDGGRYYFSRPSGDSFSLWVYDLKARTLTALNKPRAGEYQTNPFVSPNGQRLLVTESKREGSVRLGLYDARTGARLSDVAAPEGVAFEGSWLDDDRVLYSASDGAWMQTFETRLSTQQVRKLTSAPYLAAKPFSNGRTLHFLNRMDWRWTLDEVPYPALDTQTAQRTTLGSSAPAKLAEPALSKRFPARAAKEPEATPQQPSAGASTPPPEATLEAGAAAPQPAQAVHQSPAAAQPRVVADSADPRSYAYKTHREIDERPVHVVSEGHYSWIDGLFVPQGLAPWIAQRPERQVSFGLSITGGDRIGLQRWALGLGYDPKAVRPAAVLSYLNTMGAPYLVRVDAAYIGRIEHRLAGFDPSPTTAVRIQEVVAAASVSRTWYESHSAGLGLRYVRAHYAFKDTGDAFAAQQFAGPMLQLAHSSGEVTPYSGSRVAFAAGFDGSYFPAALSSVRYELGDLRLAARVVSPLPLYRRHTLTLSGRARGLVGAPKSAPLLEAGGGGSAAVPVDVDDKGTTSSARVLPPSLRFYEVLRGFEDHGFVGRRVAIADLTYKLPIIIDWGTASTLRGLPALFIPQIDVEAFFTAASLLEHHSPTALAVGMAAVLNLTFWRLPLAFRFQETRRLSHDERWAFFFSLGASGL